MIVGIAVGFSASTQIPCTVAANPSTNVATKQPVERSKAVSCCKATTLPPGTFLASKRSVEGKRK